MKNARLALILLALMNFFTAGTAGAAEILVSSDVSVSTVWTADNVYRLQNQIYVLPGATLTIEPGTVVASTAGLGGSLAVCRGGRIFVNGTADDPVIMTSTSDVATWAADAGHPTGKDPKSGTWREGVNEWGNLTIMGRALISASHFGGVPVGSNTKEPTGLNFRQMEGLTAAFPGDPNVLFGGNDDNDDSGSIHYLSIRYGGRVIGLGNELNGLSLGGIGRDTEIDHVEIMNNVDDGIEIWGGTVNLKYVNIWNIGDDSFDIDEGWRGKAQFGLIVQGYSADASQGSGVGDNCFETDGAEESDAQPVTTANIYNFTVVGQPVDGDQGTAWRDNARVQYHNMIFMELGEKLVSFDNIDGDGQAGYGFNGTLSWADTWTTPYTSTSLVNAGAFTPGAFNDPAVLYTAQTSGMLAQITDSVFYNNLFGTAYTEADARGVRNGANNNVTAGASPIQSLTRGGAVTKGGKTMLPVTSINPSAAHEARSSIAAAPSDGFFSSAQYRGGFSPNPGENWLLGWSAADAYGMIDTTPVPGGEVLVSSDITSSTVWTADNVYRLQNQIYVLPGATLTIEPGTVVASTAGLGGSLAVCRGGRIFVNGTADDPVIMTSTSDVATWAADAGHPTGKDPKSGTWREGVNEWGNLTIMGRALISASHFGGVPVGSNTKEPTGLNFRQMEGLTAAFPGDPNVLFGGNDDNDDSGSIHYLSIRYGGRVIGLGNELNGLSLGGIGRDTEIDHVEIMNNVDDGIEIWGGTVNLKYVNIWNIGDDSFDIDEGWRGKAQFGLIVQGYSADASQGSGVGDNCFETDGAEESDAQPVTTANIYNFTVVGQPVDGDQGTAWRDNARVQYHNMIFMELGEKLVSFDNIDGDGQAGYGFNGTLSWADTWTTPYTSTSLVNAGVFTPGAFNDPAVLYTAQTSGMLAQITDSVFYNNLFGTAYTEADARGVRNGANNNVTAVNSPIQSLTRGGAVTRGGKTMLPVNIINPTAVGDAVNSVGLAPNDGFFAPAQFRGGFSPNPNENWLLGWTAADAYGMVANTPVPGGEVLVTDDISISTVWTANNVYRLQNQIYVLPGATLTIEPGTVVASTAGLGGSLAVCRGGRIFVNGTADDPVIMTSTSDVATWAADAGHPTGKDPKSGTWREGVNEWGNLTIMGRALISASHFGGVPVGSNTKEPTGLNFRQMEGLTAAFPGDPNVLFGGNDDNDDSGSIHYLSIRYGGRVIGLGNELNGLSLGGIGRDTEIDHVEIMNNVDDGIEIWGGTVNLKYVNIWNIGDDSFDIDEGWRGKAQFGLIVQGYSADASQGSGVGDNCFETDGAEESDAQPVTTANIYNFTVVGQPVDGDQGTAWRDNARVQYHNMIFMELGEKLVSFDNDDGDGQAGYGFNGTLPWVDIWTTPYTSTSLVNAGAFTPGAFNDPAVLYTAQTSGMLAQITDSVFYNNLFGTAYTEADARGVRNGANNNVTAGASPIQSLTRGGAVTKGGKTMLPVTNINPTPINNAASSVGMAPNDGFFTPAKYRGGFSPNPNQNWLKGWSAADAYGMLSLPANAAVPSQGWMEYR